MVTLVLGSWKQNALSEGWLTRTRKSGPLLLTWTQERRLSTFFSVSPWTNLYPAIWWRSSSATHFTWRSCSFQLFHFLLGSRDSCLDLVRPTDPALLKSTCSSCCLRFRHLDITAEVLPPSSPGVCKHEIQQAPETRAVLTYFVPNVSTLRRISVRLLLSSADLTFTEFTKQC